jgi:hypothetical protein
VRNALLLLILLLFASCAIEEAQPKKERQLTIAQNFMSKAQKQILLKIAKRRSIDLNILDLSAGKMRNAIQKNQWEPGFDLLILDGLQAQNTLKGLSFQFAELGYAAQPIGVSYVPDSVVKVRHFKDLSTQYLWAAADAKSEAILKLNLAYAYRKRDTDKKLNKAYKDLLRGFKDHKLAYDTYQLQNTLLLSTYSTHLHKLKKAVKKRQFTFALGKSKRYFADYMSLFIVEQTPQYHTALRFVRFLHYMRDHNTKFQKAFGIMPKPTVTQQPTPRVLLEFLEK